MPIDSILLDAGFIAFSYLLSFVIGLPIADRLKRVRLPYITAPIFGYAVIGMIAMVLYRAGLTVPTVFYTVSVIAAVILVSYARRLSQWLRRDWLNKQLSANRLVICGWLVAVLLTIIPAWTGGPKYAVFQGNHWDQLSYVTASTVLSKEPYNTIASSGTQQCLKNPLMSLAKLSLADRPTVMLLYGTLSQIAPKCMYKLGYAFEAMMLSMSFGAVLFLAANVFPIKGKWLTSLGVFVSLAFVLGFWGQYIFDINAWSQVSSMPLTVLLVTHLLLALQQSSKNMLQIAIVCSSLLYFYPEQMLFFLPLMAVLVALSLLLSSNRKALVKPIATLSRAGVLSSLCTIPVFQNTVGGIIAKPGARPEGWFRYFDGFYGGCSGGPPLAINFNGIADSLAGLLGLYFITPGREWSIWLAAADRAGLLTLCTSAIAASCIAIVLRHNRKATQLFQFWLLSFAGSLALGFTGNAWMGGKAVSFVSPFLMLLLLTPLLAGVKKSQYWLLTPALLILCAQLSFGIMRPVATKLSATMPYDHPYPSTQDPTIKRGYDWDVDRLKPELDKFSLCEIDVANPWLRHHLMVFFYCNDKNFHSKAPVCSYYLPKSEIGKHQVQGTPDCVLELVEDNIALHNSNKKLTMSPVVSQ